MDQEHQQYTKLPGDQIIDMLRDFHSGYASDKPGYRGLENVKRHYTDVWQAYEAHKAGMERSTAEIIRKDLCNIWHWIEQCTPQGETGNVA